MIEYDGLYTDDRIKNGYALTIKNLILYKYTEYKPVVVILQNGDLFHDQTKQLTFEYIQSMKKWIAVNKLETNNNIPLYHNAVANQQVTNINSLNLLESIINQSIYSTGIEFHNAIAEQQRLNDIRIAQTIAGIDLLLAETLTEVNINKKN